MKKINYIMLTLILLGFISSCSPQNNEVQIINSPWDGSVSQVKKFLNKNLKDPDSYEGIEWGKVKKHGDVYKVYHKYRAKNSFGGYVVEKHIFTINSNGSIINVK